MAVTPSLQNDIQKQGVLDVCDREIIFGDAVQSDEHPTHNTR